MEKVLVFGHKSPDTDSICSTLAMANLQTKLRGEEVIPCRLGELNEETKYALKYFEVEAPKFIEKVEEGQNVILVDHNEFSQSVAGIENAKIIAVVDHHRINNFQTSEPLFYYAQPVGCTATILLELFKANNIEIEPKIAGLMLSAIISDTLLLKSPTTTDKDKKAVEELAKIANVDISKYGLDMLKAGTDISEFTPFQVINMDSKEFDDEHIKFEISQVNAIDLNSVFSRQSELENAIQKEIDDKNLDFYMFAATDILNANSKIIAMGRKANTVEKAFGVNLENNTAILNNVVSRKKQMLPNILNNLD